MRLIGAASTLFAVALTAALIQAGAAHPRAEEPDGRQIFRFDTFGDEQLWTNVLRMHEVVATVDPDLVEYLKSLLLGTSLLIKESAASSNQQFEAGRRFAHANDAGARGDHKMS
jgi:hypothetical protein